MKKETKQRIKYYQRLLPGLRERVAAAGLMLFIAVIVTVTATYAWVTLSRAPEITGVNTTVTSNGNLEIALSPEDGNQPAEFDVDESASKSTDVTVSNLQWGNLINLSDPAYGIDNFVLRPAQLNTASLSFSPLWGAVYGADGRITTLNSDYTFTKWDGNQFMVSRDYGVRAIASYIQTVSDTSAAEYNRVAEEVYRTHMAVNTEYSKVPDKMKAMESMLSSYAQSKVDDKETAFTSADLKAAYDLYKAVYDTMAVHKDALVALANFQLYVNAKNNQIAYEPITWEELETNKAKYNAPSADKKSSDGIVSIIGLDQFISDLKMAESDVGYLQTYYEGVGDGSMTVYWSTGGVENHQINNIVNNMMAYSQVTIALPGKEEVKLTSLGASNALDFVNKDVNVYIYNGILKRFEQHAIDEAYRMQGDNASATITIKVSFITAKIYGHCYTKASGVSDFMAGYTDIMGNKLVGTDAVAEDTYGMAVDFWVRTNAESTYLTLEGALVTDENTQEVLSYDGVNRVWGSSDNSVLTRNSTTQGNGSCYIYYADTPEDMMRSLNLLQSMKVAFVDSDGNLLAGARMDTDNYYAVNGRITVPMIVEENTGVTYTYTDDQNAEQTGYALTHMVSDSAKRITAIIYLDGTRLTNAEVLAAADIQGQMNIQFGSSQNLETIGDNKLLVAERTVTATVNKTSMNFDEAITDADLTASVTVRVEGTEPTRVTAFFTRAINATQGQREATMTFTKQSGGEWTASYKFNAPGTYYLRYVRLDGVDYILEDPPKVEVEGFAIKDITWSEASDEATIYAPESSYTETVFVEFASTDADKMPTAVSGRFLRDDGVTVSVDMKYNSSIGKWTGSGTFYNSGTYTLQYLLLNGEYFDIGEESKILTLSLGMQVEVYNNGNTLVDEYDVNAANGTYSKKVGVKIYDNEQNEIGELTGARLRYSLGGSSTNTVDTNLTWDEVGNWYTGTLPITKPGRYTCLEVILGTSKLTKVIDAPTFVVVSPEPPIYDSASKSTFHDEVQFAPLTNDAYIGPIKIKNSGAASVSMEVYNDVSKETYTVVQGNVEGANGTISQEGETWYINLPTYTLDVGSDGKPEADAVYTQEGTWSVKSISIWDCYDENTNYRQADNPIVWTDADTDFSRLSTTVSCSVNVSMNPGTTSIGSPVDAFMSNHYVKDIGMYVELKDNAGRTIPARSDRTVALTVAYAGNSSEADIAAYGYEVTGFSRDYTINLVQDAASGKWVVADDSNHNWQYVGKYAVTDLTVKMAGVTSVYTSASGIGVPEMYTVTSNAPTANNLAIKRISQNTTVFGKDEQGNVTGLFLSSYNPGISVELQLTYTDEKGETKEAVNARVAGTSVSLNLTYKDGMSAPNGGYSWSTGDSYMNITMPMTNTNTGTMIYNSGVSVLHAGTYGITGTLTVNGSTSTFEGLNDIEVYSKAPQLTVASYTQRTGLVLTRNINTVTDEYGFDKERQSSWFSGSGAISSSYYKTISNRYDATENICEVYIPLVEISESGNNRTIYALLFNDSSSADITTSSSHNPCPTVKLKLSNINTGITYGNISISMIGSKGTTVQWNIPTGSVESDIVSIGAVSGDHSHTNSNAGCTTKTHHYKTRTVFGSGTVSQIDIPYNSCTYTVTIEKPLTINNPY